LLALGIVVMAFFVYTTARKPSESIVNGTYFNPCCKPIILKDGQVNYGSLSSTYRIERMKFGLTAYVKGSLDGNDNSSDPDNTVLLFSSKTDSEFRAVVNGQEYVFTRNSK
jgi:hypothetical protein